MKAIKITKAGGPEVLQIAEVKSKEPAANEVLIRVRAAGVNRSDILTRKNPDAYGKGIPGATIPGLEVSGEIIKIGSDVETRRVGDKVCALIAGGG
ncbi:MAG: alcohol dehydrogenase catalytic domain-containing protein, partial [Leeuwenhoekiella sp.]